MSFEFPSVTVSREDVTKAIARFTGNGLLIGSYPGLGEPYGSYGPIISGDGLSGYVYEGECLLNGYYWEFDEEKITLPGAGHYYIYIQCDTSVSPMFSIQYATKKPSHKTGWYVLLLAEVDVVALTAGGYSQMVYDKRVWLHKEEDAGWIDLSNYDMECVVCPQYRRVGTVCYLRGTMRSDSGKLIGKLPALVAPGKTVTIIAPAGDWSSEGTKESLDEITSSVIVRISTDGSVTWNMFPDVDSGMFQGFEISTSWIID